MKFYVLNLGLDSRDKKFIKSRATNEKISAFYISNLEDINSFNLSKVKLIVIDEAQFLNGDINIILKLHIINNIDFIISRTKLRFRLKTFWNHERFFIYCYFN